VAPAVPAAGVTEHGSSRPVNLQDEGSPAQFFAAHDQTYNHRGAIIMKLGTHMAATILATTIVTVSAAAAAGNHGGNMSAALVADASTLDATETANLVYMREEEKLARDVYITFYGTWSLPVFDNIAASEETHTTQVQDMLEKYRITDPVADDSVGVFVDPKLASLYTTLVAQGSASSLAALYVGAAIEEIDMIDLQAAIDASDNADIKQLYENLMSGSRNHLRAYVGQIEDLGIVYEAQYLTQEEVDAIVDAPVERGSSRR
jgi:hypothetical protein